MKAPLVTVKIFLEMSAEDLAQGGEEGDGGEEEKGEQASLRRSK